MSVTKTLKVKIAKALCHPLIGRAVRAWFGGVIPSRGCRIDTRHPSIAAETVASLFWGLYESAEIRFVDRYLPEELDVVELGASLSAVSAHAARRLAPGQRLVSVEANPGLLDLIASNVRSNAPRVGHEVVHCAISYGGTPTVAFSIADRNIHSALTSEGREGRAVEIPAMSSEPSPRQANGRACLGERHRGRGGADPAVRSRRIDSLPVHVD